MSDRIWTDADFDSMSWHDVTIHGIRLIEREPGCGDLVLDIDYILEWIRTGQHYELRRQAASLTFHGVYDLRISIDYARCGAGFTPFSIDGIERHEEQRNGYVAQLWKIPINWPTGEITFFASGFEQRSRGEPCISSAGVLTPEERGDVSPNRPTPTDP